MEEIYKPDADGPEKVEVYSRENNDMLEIGRAHV